MKTILALVSLLAASGCGVYNPIYFHCQLEDGCSYTAHADNDWLEPAVREAVEFWNDHGVDISYAEEGGMVVEMSITDPAHGTSWFDEFQQKVEIAPSYEEPSNDWKGKDFGLARKCIAVHEIGHSFGMPHSPVSDEGVMSPRPGLANGDCAFTKGEQYSLAELKQEGSDQ